jgi:hypothetical protein
MRHAVESQFDPLADDDETGCFHEAHAAWNHLMRLYHARRTKDGQSAGARRTSAQPGAAE